MELPEEIVINILSRLPAKSIMKFKSCSKSINRSIKRGDFIVKHNQNLSLQGGDSSFFIQGGSREKIKICVLPGNKASLSSSDIIPKRFLQFLYKRSGRILLSCNGLVLCSFYPRRGFLWREFIIGNPTTQFFSSIVVPESLQLNRGHVFISLAFESNQNQYQLLLFEYFRFRDRDQDRVKERVVCKTYMPEEREWKQREKSKLIGHSWMILCPYFDHSYSHVLFYNLEDGKMLRLRFPKEVRGRLDELYYNDVCVLKGKGDGGISLVIWDQDNLIFNFWAWEDYRSSSSSWLMLKTLSLEDMGLEKDYDVLGFTVINEHYLVFATDGEVYQYDLDSEEGNKVEKIRDHNFKKRELSFFTYSNTLYSCGGKAKHLAFFV